MLKKKWLPFFLIIMILVNLAVLWFAPVRLENFALEMTVTSDSTGNYQLYYSDDGDFWIDQVVNASYSTPKEEQVLRFGLGTSPYEYYRLDFGEQAANIVISDLKFVCGKEVLEIPISVLTESIDRNAVVSIEKQDNTAQITVEAGDPRCVLQMGEMDRNSVNNFIKNSSMFRTMLYRIAVCIAIDILLIGIFCVGKNLKNLLHELIQNRRLIMKLAVNDFKTKYVGSYLGIIWAFIQPIVTVVVYWFVFSVGLRVTPTGNVPFVLYLVSGMVPWFFFSDSLSGGTTALVEYQYLVKKIVFKISMLPMVKIISAMFVHLFFIGVALVIAVLNGYYPGWYSLQLFYYIFCNFVFSLAIVYITSSIVVFFRDITQIISIVLQVGIWTLPIMYDFNVIPVAFQRLFKLNPMFYIVDGYRDSIVYRGGIWDKFYETIWFWFVTAVLFGIGTMVFKRLKVHFADVL